MNFCGRFFHQLAMGTSMAVNYANLFMSRFESNLLQSYTQKFGCTPVIWLRYIDDIIYVWIGEEQTLKHFLDYCNNYSSATKMKSNIKFSYAYSTESVNFLDVTVQLEQSGSLSTTLYSKATASHLYLHHSSFHPPHTIRAIPKSQFIRIRRLCTYIEDYWLNVNKFIQYFVKHGYSKKQLENTARVVSEMDRETLLVYRNRPLSTRIPLILTWHNKIRNIPRVISNACNVITRQYPSFKDIFKEPPMIVYRRPRNVKSFLVKTKPRSTKNATSTPRATKTRIEKCMNSATTVTNKQNKRTCKIEGGSANDSSVIYSAECTKHNLLSVGQTGNTLNQRFNGHRSDILHHPERCELPKHYNTCSCDFDKELQISVLEKVNGPESKRLLQEDEWITRLNTIHPYG